MESFIWNKNFETGLAEIDQQHNRLIDIINQFGDLISDNELEILPVTVLRAEPKKVYLSGRSHAG